jgi:signal transduction histidine kinase
VIEVADNGVGFPAENRERIFANGFTTKKSGRGYGLHYSATAAKELGGTLDAQSHGSGKGAVFTLSFPYRLVSQDAAA